MENALCFGCRAVLLKGIHGEGVPRVPFCWGLYEEGHRAAVPPGETRPETPEARQATDLQATVGRAGDERNCRTRGTGWQKQIVPDRF